MIGVYAIVDPTACRGREPREVARAAIRGGARRVQLRTKGGRDRASWQLATDLAVMCAEADVGFVVNDRIDLALLVDASEVHLGQDDLPIEAARRIAPRLLVGRSTHDLEQVRIARAQGADRIAFGPVFPTRSKLDPDPVVGVEALAQAIELASGTPVVAIGGIDVARARELRSLALSEIAVISAICAADDPERATRELRESLA